jgi:hypothetical protein
MRLPRFLAGPLVFSSLCALPICARAQTIDTQAGNAFSDGGAAANLMCLATASGDKKLAGMIIRGPDPKQDIYKPRIAYFVDQSEWDKFVQLWSRARTLKAPARTNANGDSTDVGKYWDDADQVLVTVAVNDDLTIEFDIVDADKNPLLFRLRPKDFDEFSRDVVTVSAYFGK